MYSTVAIVRRKRDADPGLEHYSIESWIANALSMFCCSSVFIQMLADLPVSRAE